MANNLRSGTRLSDAKLRNLQPGSDVLTHAAVSGLMISPSKTTKGIGSWYIRFYNPENKSQRVVNGNLNLTPLGPNSAI